MSEKKCVPVGIDLGTTYSAVAFVDNQGRPSTIENSEGQLTTPSVVYFDPDGAIVGNEAEVAGETDPARLARLAKREMGGGWYSKPIAGKSLRPEVIQSIILQRLKSDAELRLGEFREAVITVPAYFNEPRRKATQDAGELAGLDVIDIINEPTAAALAYGVQRGFLNEKGIAQEDELVLVYDLGGGTFDATLMKISGSEYTAIATAGDVFLGGVDWDQAIFEYAAEKFLAEHGIDCKADPLLQEKLIRECGRAKKSLTARPSTLVRIDADGKRVSLDLDRDKLESLTAPLLERTRLTMERLLGDADLNGSQLTRLLLVGGSTRMPMVARMLEKETGLKVDRSISPDEAIAHGAAIYAGILMKHGPTSGQGITVDNVNSHDLGVLGIDPTTRQPRRKIIIPRNQRLPASQQNRFQTSRTGQSRVVVQIVEGGTESGQGATHIGKCVVDDLPSDLKQGSPVLVEFNYSSAGRLEVKASLPSLDRQVSTRINRSQGMDPQEVAKWRTFVRDGATIDSLQLPWNESPPQLEASAEKSGETKAPSVAIPAKNQSESVADDAGKAADEDLAKLHQLASGMSPMKEDATISQIRIDAADAGPRPSEVNESDIFNELTLSEQKAKELASESMLDFLGDENAAEKASASDTSLGEFLKGLGN